MQQKNILHYLKQVKPYYENEGFIIEGLFGSYARNEATEKSDIDILMHTTPSFVKKYGFSAISRIKEIENELSRALKKPVDIASSSGMGKTAQKFILDQTIYI